MVLSGLIVGGHVRRKGEVVEIPEHLPLDPYEQREKWSGKIYYVECESAIDKKKVKEKLGTQEIDLADVSGVNISPQFTPEGADALKAKDKPENVITEADLPNLLPQPFEVNEEQQADEIPEVENAQEEVQEGKEKEVKATTAKSRRKKVKRKAKKKAVKEE